MAHLGLEIDDAGLVVASSEAVLAVEPGYAQSVSGELRLGDVARKAAKLNPRQTSLRYWDELALDQGSDAIEGFSSTAEIAHKQLKELWLKHSGSHRSAVIVPPAHFDREKLSLLLGVAQESGISVSGLVPAAVAVADASFPGGQLMHLGFSLHRAQLSQLDQSPDQVALERSDSQPGLGLNDLQHRLAYRVAELFVSQTRFDPLHQAASEQRLFDQLPQWLAALADGPEVEAALEFSGQTFAVPLTEHNLLGAVAGRYRALVQWIAAVREPGASLALMVDAEALSLPGLRRELEAMADVYLIPKPKGAAARAVASWQQWDGISGQGVSLTQTMAWRAPAIEEKKGNDVASASSGLQPEYLVHKGIAHRVGDAGLALGRGVQDSPGLRLGGSGVSQQHCLVERRGSALWLVDQSRYGTFVNEKRVAGETSLNPGDVIRLGSPGVELVVVAIQEPSRGA